MKPVAFEYLAPGSVADCVSLLKDFSQDAKILAGGQSLVPLMNFRLVRPRVIVDINRIDELNYVSSDGNALNIGALTRQRVVELNPDVVRLSPLMGEALPLIGHFQIRNRGTLGGSVVHADPAAELPAVLVTLGGRLTLRSYRGTRVVPAAEFFQGYLSTTAEPDELLTNIEIPALRPREGGAILEVAQRAGDFALIGVACKVVLDDARVVKTAAATFFGTGNSPIAAAGAPLLVGTHARDTDLAEARKLSVAELDTQSDIHASAEYRRSVAGVLLERALRTAYGRAKGVVA